MCGQTHPRTSWRARIPRGGRSASGGRPGVPGLPGLLSLLGRRILPAGLAILLVLLQPTGGARAQEPSLLDLDLEYQAALSSHRAARDAWEVVFRRWEQALTTVDDARSRGDGEAWDEAQRRFRSEADELQLRERRVWETRETLEEVRTAYLRVLDRRRRDLEAELDSGLPPERREDVRILLDDVLNKYGELESARVDPEPQLAFFPTIRPDPRDGPDEYAQAVAFLERKDERAERAMEQIDEEIERIQARMRGDRQRQGLSDFRAGLGRYGDTRPPVGSTAGERDERPAPADSTAAADVPTLEERLERLVGDRRQLQAYRDQLQARIREFRRLLRVAA